MSNRHIYAMTPEARAKLLSMFPNATPAQWVRFDDLVKADRLLTDEGKPTQAFVAWVARVMTK